MYVQVRGSRPGGGNAGFGDVATGRCCGENFWGLRELRAHEASVRHRIRMISEGALVAT